MAFELIQPSKTRHLSKCSTIRFQGRQLCFSRKATMDLFGDLDGYVLFYLDAANKRLGVKPVDYPENAFSIRIYRKKVSPLGVVFAAEVVAKIAELSGQPSGTYALFKDSEAGMYVAKLG